MPGPAAPAAGGGADANPAAILLGGGVIALPVARSLSRAGVRVCALGHESDPVRWSRHCSVFVDTGAGPAVVERWLDWLERGPREGVVLPCSDEGLGLVVSHRARLEDLGYVLIEADDRVLSAILDKERTAEIAEAAGIPVPRTVALRSEADLTAASELIGFPCAMKPIHSHLFAHRFGASKKVLLATDPAELRQAFLEMRDLGIDLLVTETVPGPDDQFVSYYSYLDERGEPLFHFTKRKLRQHPPRFGMGCYHVTDWNPEVAEMGLRFYQGVGLRGLACVEFKRDGRDGRLVLIESNHRFTAATGLLRAAGVDLALFTYNRLLGRELPPMEPYRRGLHLWVPGPDVRAFSGYRRLGELTLGSWIASLMAPLRLPLASFEDPGPSLGTFGYRLRRRVRRFLADGPKRSRGERRPATSAGSAQPPGWPAPDRAPGSDTGGPAES